MNTRGKVKCLQSNLCYGLAGLLRLGAEVLVNGRADTLTTEFCKTIESTAVVLNGRPEEEIGILNRSRVDGVDHDDVDSVHLFALHAYRILHLVLNVKGDLERLGPARGGLFLLYGHCHFFWSGGITFVNSQATMVTTEVHTVTIPIWALSAIVTRCRVCHVIPSCACEPILTLSLYYFYYMVSRGKAGPKAE